VKSFLTGWREDGRVVVDANLRERDFSEALPQLAEWEASQRSHLAFTAPEYAPWAALWALERLYRACQLLVCRDTGESEVMRLLRVKCPEPPGPATTYSADLIFQYLPDVLEMARRVAVADPLVRELEGLAQAWPLSSVGVAGLGEPNLETFAGHAGLMQLYVDRILSRGDHARLADARVKAVARAALGAYPELDPKAMAWIEPGPE
jgi:hypothetical protein